MARTPFDVTVKDACTYVGDTQNVTNQVPRWRFSESTTGVSRRKPQEGFIPPTAYTLFYRNVSNAYGSCKNIHSSNPGLTQVYTGVVGGGTGVLGRFNSGSHFDAAMLESATDPSIDNAALIEARTKLKGEGVNLGIAFAERKRTARLVGDTATNIGMAFRFLRNGQTRKAMDRLGITSARREPRGGNVPQKWLELQYGWKPLLSDVYGSVKRLNRLDQRDWLVTSKAKRRSETLRTVTFSGLESGVMVVRRTDSVFVRIDGGPNNDLTMSLESLGILNPLLVGWELVPYSFVVDWFLPVGGYLESITALLGFKVLGYSSSHLTRISWDGSGTSHNPPGPYRVENSYLENKRTVNLVRTVGTTVPQARFPDFKDPRSLGHMANGLALLATAFGRGRSQPAAR